MSRSNEPRKLEDIVYEAVTEVYIKKLEPRLDRLERGIEELEQTETDLRSSVEAARQEVRNIRRKPSDWHGVSWKERRVGRKRKQQLDVLALR